MSPPQLEEVYDRYREDPAFKHLRTPSIRLVPGFGSYRPKVLVVGEAPGATENTRGRPFCGASGRVLAGLMESAGLRLVEGIPEWADDGIGNYGDVEKPANAFITNVVKYRPPGNRTPTEEEVAASVPYLRDEWRALGRPAVIIAVGSVAKSALIPHIRLSLTQSVNKPYNTKTRGVVVIPEFHPAYGLRRESVRQQMEVHWEELGEYLRREGITSDEH